MAPGIFTAMGEDRLLLAQWLSPAFPIGAFAYSQGMETAMAGGVLRDAAGVESWVRATLRFGTPRMDAVIAAHWTCLARSTARSILPFGLRGSSVSQMKWRGTM